MRTFTNGLHAEMSEELEQIAHTSDNILHRAERSYHAVDQAIEKLKSFILSYMFKDENEEITFFKKIKPMFQKEFIYYEEVFAVEHFIGPVGPKEVIAFYLMAAGRVDLHFKRYNGIYTYYRTGRSDNDRQYFLRGKTSNDVITPISSSDIDPRFSTAYSFQFAKLQAYEKFSKYLQQRIYSLEHPEIVQPGGEKDGNAAIWTDAKVDLIELGYGISAKASVNNGKASLKLIMDILGRAFNIDLSNYAGLQRNIRQRKRKERTHYLSDMIDTLERIIDQSENNPAADF